MKNLILIVSLLIPSLVLAQSKLEKVDTSKVIKIGAEQSSVARWKDGKKMVFPQEKPEVVKEKVKPNILTKEEKVSMSSSSRATKAAAGRLDVKGKSNRPEVVKEKVKSPKMNKEEMSANSRAAKGSKSEKGFKPEPTKEKMKSMEKGSGKIKRSSQKAINSIEKGKGKKEKVKVKIDK
jgi:hypothetical protein